MNKEILDIEGGHRSSDPLLPSPENNNRHQVEEERTRRIGREEDNTAEGRTRRRRNEDSNTKEGEKKGGDFERGDNEEKGEESLKRTDYGTQEFYNRNETKYEVTGTPSKEVREERREETDVKGEEIREEEDGERADNLRNQLTVTPSPSPTSPSPLSKYEGEQERETAESRKRRKDHLHHQGVWKPRCDMIEYEDFLRILVELPGVEKENIDLSLSRNKRLRIEAKKTLPEISPAPSSSPSPSPSPTSSSSSSSSSFTSSGMTGSGSAHEPGTSSKFTVKDNVVRFLRNEVHYGTYFRSLEIPVLIDTSPFSSSSLSVPSPPVPFQAEFEEGILSIDLPKPSSERTRRLLIPSRDEEGSGSTPTSVLVSTQ